MFATVTYESVDGTREDITITMKASIAMPSGVIKNDQKITKNVTYTRSGQHITISSGDEAVAFEVKKGSEIMYFSNFFSFDIPASIPWNDSMKIYAVQANGERKEVKSN